MPSVETLYQALAVLIAANLALLAIAFIVSRRRRARAEAEEVDLAARLSPTAAEWPASSESVESAAAPVPEMTAPGPPATSYSVAGTPYRTPVFASESQAARPFVTTPPNGGTRVDLDGLIDPATGLETSLAWDEALRHEEARHDRYGRTATVVVGELEGLENLAGRLGRDAADRLIPPVAQTLRRETRAADVVARVGYARFHVLLPETDEVAAINCVDRIRQATDLWLASGAVAVRFALGWASPTKGATLADAVRVAEERMNADRHSRAGPRPPRRTPAPEPEDASA